MGAREDTADLLDRLRSHYLPEDGYPGGLLLTETGWNGATHPTRADALYVGFTSTAGRHLVGHEVKVSRADWQRELDKPGKADAWADQCHAWYVVAPSTDIVRPDELPDGWGLLVPNPRTSRRLKVAVKARLHPDRTPSWDAVRSLLARQDTLARDTARQVRAEAAAAARTELLGTLETLRATQLNPHTKARLAVLDELETGLGVTLVAGRWHDVPGACTPDQLLAALRLVQASRRLPDATYLDHTRRILTDALTQLDAAGTALTALHGALDADPGGSPDDPAPASPGLPGGR